MKQLYSMIDSLFNGLPSRHRMDSRQDRSPATVHAICVKAKAIMLAGRGGGKRQILKEARMIEWNGTHSTRRRVLAALVGVFAASAFPVFAQNSSPITLGLVSPLSEPGDARSGQAIKKTADLWVKEINASGGILGHPVKLAVYDDQGKVEVGAAGVERAITEAKASAILGVWSSSVTLAEMEVAKRYNVPLLSFYSWSDDITSKNYPQVFRIGPYNSKIAAQMAAFVEKAGYKKVVILAEDTAYGLGFAKSFAASVKQAHGIALDTVQFQAQTQDLTAQMSRIAAMKPDVVIVQGVFAATNLSIKQGREVGLKADIIAGWDWPTLPDFWPAVGEAGVGIIYPTFNDPSLSLTSEGKHFVSSYKKTYGADPAIFQYYLWDNFNAVKAAIVATGKTDPAALVQALPKVKFEGTIGEITFSHEPGTVRFNQWDAFAMFFKRLAKVGDSDAQAKLINAVK